MVYGFRLPKLGRGAMEELKEQLRSPFPFSTELVAFKGMRWVSSIQKHIEEIKWEVRIVVSGPDGRYNPGKATISRQHLPALIRVLSEVKKKAEALNGVMFSGKYQETFTTPVAGLSFELSAEHERVSVKIWVDNDTRWRFSRSLPVPDIDQAIAILEGLEGRGDKMVETLEIILGKREVLTHAAASEPGEQLVVTPSSRESRTQWILPPPPPPPPPLSKGDEHQQNPG